MSHWYVQGRLGQEHRADLDREADRAALSKAVREGGRATRRSGIRDAAIGLVGRFPWRRPQASEAAADHRLLGLEHDV